MTVTSEQQLVGMLAALGHPLRLRIFRFVMRQGPEGVPAGEIARALGIGTSNLSFHLKELRYANWVEAQRRGQQILYRAQYSRVQAFLEAFQDQCCADVPSGCGPVCGAVSRNPTDTTENEAT